VTHALVWLFKYKEGTPEDYGWDGKSYFSYNDTLSKREVKVPVGERVAGRSLIIVKLFNNVK
jgi:hypothetical protein